MKVTVINGNARHGSTWNSMNAIIQELGRFGSVEKTEFFLPKDMPHFCVGCFSCFFKGEQACPHAQSVQPIAQAILDADVVILTSSVYAMDVTGQMKALLDHLCYMWMSHRPNPKMFGKFWGAARVLNFKNAVSAMKWDDVSDKKKARMSRDAARLAKRIAGYVKKGDKMPVPLFRSFFMGIMKGMMSKNTWNPRDRKHWEDHG